MVAEWRKKTQHEDTARGESLARTIPATEDVHVVKGEATANVKLPKLYLKKFGGDLAKWLTFWDVFESAIHNNPSLSPVDKFNYLKSVVESTAAEAIVGLTLTAVNTIATLTLRFGNKQLIVNQHMKILLNVEAVSS